MRPARFTEEFQHIFQAALGLAWQTGVDAALVLLEGPTDWNKLRDLAGNQKVILVGDTPDELDGAASAGFDTIIIETADGPVFERLSQALLKAIGEEILAPGGRVVALYSGFEPGEYDSLSVLDLGDHLGRLTVRDLRQLETRVPLDTLQTVVNLALEIGREGREGKPVGTLFVVGDTAKVRRLARPASFDPVKGYSRKERNLKSAKVREAVKEIAQIDGAFLVAPDGTVEAAAQYLDASAADVTLSKGLGARHWAAAATSRATQAVAVAVSESSGTVRIFQNGECVLRIEPLQRAMKWRGFDVQAGG